MKLVDNISNIAYSFNFYLGICKDKENVAYTIYWVDSEKKSVPTHIL